MQKPLNSVLRDRLYYMLERLERESGGYHKMASDTAPGLAKRLLEQQAAKIDEAIAQLRALLSEPAAA